MSSARVTVATGDVVFREGDAPTTAFLIEVGRVEIRTARNGVLVRLATLGPGDLLGEMAVIDDAARTATAIAIEPCVLLSIDRAAIGERLQQADPIVRSLLEGQLRRYRGALAAMQGHGDDVVAAESGPASHAEQLGIGKFRLESQLRDALLNNGLDLRLQPLYEISTRRIAGFEALVRWNHPERGQISPLEFIALAEETSLINPVGEYVLDAAISALRALKQRNAAEAPFIAINVSPRQLAETGLIERIVERTRAVGVAPDRIKVEITESQMVDYPTVRALIQRCHEFGIKVAMDDFGTGYSNLGHLHELEFDSVKVDQAFPRQMMDSPRAMGLLRSIVDMLHAIGADVVVEGIETQDQLEAIAAMGVRYAQGYLIGKPLLLEEVFALARPASASPAPVPAEA
jgi:diguanylate cyclase